MQRVHACRVARTRVAAVAAMSVMTCVQRGFHSQHHTPILPQLPVHDPAPPARVHVAYLLQRNQVVRHTPHPLESELAYLLDREHQRYARHEANDSAVQFMAARGQTLDLFGRTDAAAIKGNFYGIELYQDAMSAVLQRYKPESRVTAADLVDPTTLRPEAPPPRHTLHRCLDDYLYLLVRDAATERWTVPQTPRRAHESLRTTAERAVAQHHAGELDVYAWSNAPQATVYDAAANAHVFIYVMTYLSGRPHFDQLEPASCDHAWVTRGEMVQYSDAFASEALLHALLDIAADSTFEAA